MVLLHAASLWLGGAAPNLALAANPLNTRAREAAILRQLEVGEVTPAMDADAGWLMALAPGVATGYSVAARVQEAEGDEAAAAALYATAHGLARTEIGALLALLQRALAGDDHVRSIELVDIVLRRWPVEYGAAVMPLLTQVIADRAGRLALDAALAGNPPWRRMVVGYLLGDAEGIGFIAEMLRAEGDRDSNRSEIVETIERLFARGRYGAAYQFYLSTRSPAERLSAGYVNDERFTAAPSGKLFGWRVAPKPGAVITLGAEPGGGLSVRFLDRPTPLGFPSQSLMLWQGRYRLTAEAAAEGLEVPDRLFWDLGCQDGGSLATLALAEGSHGTTTVATDFAIGAATCPVQRLTLRTGSSDESWLARNTGRVQISRVHIERLGE